MDKSNKAVKRAKVRLQFPEKIFYEKTLIEWKENITDKNHGFVIKKALNNLKLFPLNVQGFTELRKIRGIGEDIATRLDAAWKQACQSHFKCEAPDLQQVNTLGRGEFFRFLEQTTSNVGGRKRNVVPFVPKNRINYNNEKAADSKQKMSRKATTTTKGSANVGTKPAKDLLLVRSSSHEPIADNCPPINEMMEYDDFPGISASQPEISLQMNKDYGSEMASTSSGSLAPRFPPTSFPKYIKNFHFHHHQAASTSASTELAAIDGLPTNCSSQAGEPLDAMQHQLTCMPSQTANARLLLIADNREGIAGTRTKHKGKAVGEHLVGLGVNCESRPLSVADYLWVLQWTNRDGKPQELVLDYVVERKTWDDLKKSIRDIRYMEQKSRLRRCGLPNVIMLVEGGFNADRSLEQAMVSTSVENGFLIHRTQNMQGTAKFLHNLTKRLEERCKREPKIVGPSFEFLQERCKKPTPASVADCWLRQLTVCPGMSLERAKLIHQLFPTFRALTNFYKTECRTGNQAEDQALLANWIPRLPASISKQMHAFYQQAFAE